MPARLSIRSYSFSSHTHAHPFHQLVLPLIGSVFIDTGRHQGKASPGDCIITLADQPHHFAPDAGSAFLVADMEQLPDNLTGIDESFVRVPAPIQAFCFFVQKQLEHKVSPDLEQQMGCWFVQLLNEHSFSAVADPRIQKAIDYMVADLSLTPSIDELSQSVYLSSSQFKKLFRQQTGKSSGQYLLQQRMNKARALLTHTDYPVSVIAQQLGYQDLSAFSHRFSQHFGFSPRKLRG